MTCPQCGNDNPPKLKFCVKCGMNLENPQEINYEQVDLGNYHSEDDGSSGGFRLGGGTFTIKDSAPTNSSSDFYTADELNSDEEEFDFSSFDEPFIPKLDAGRVSLPQMNGMMQPQMGGMPQMNGMMQQQMGGMPQMNGMMQQQMGAMPQMNGMPQPQMGGMSQMNGMPQQQMNGVPQMNGMAQQPMMFAQPQIIGYDQNGMPIYGQAQPMMFAQPQIIGYDQNGMPIYGQAQPMMFAQPQIIGYDQNGMPIYGQAQPMMFQQPPILGENGEPLPNNFPGLANIQQQMGIPGMPMQQPQQQFYQQPQQPQPQEELVEVSDDFWKFFDGGKATERHDASDDFFGKHGMGDVSASGMDMGRLKRFDHKKNDYMNDTPLVDGSKLAAYSEAKYNKLYMRQTDKVNADDLAANDTVKQEDIMGITQNVDASRLNSHMQVKSRISMEHTENADANELEAFVPEHKRSMMGSADHAVEALPKKKTTYVDEIDAIELPEYMQARKTVKDDSPKIPGLPEI